VVAEPDASAPGQRPRPVRLLPLDLVRGFLIGSAELVPGVSGGTVALVTGVYEQLISSATHVLGAGRALVLGPDRQSAALTELRRTDWRLILPVLFGMGLAVLTIAGVMSSFVTDHPEHARGLFFGLVAASVIVPIRMLPPAHRSTVFDGALALAAAVTAYLLVSLASGGTSTDPPLYVVFFAAAVAVCALVVPGVSGSFLLLAIGIYTATLDAVSGRDLAYLAVFAAGAACGLASFVQLLGYLLREHRRTTLVVMTGLMVGSLRALWPWQSSSGGHDGGPGALLAPTEPLAGPLMLMVLGVAVVLALVWVQALVEGRESREQAERTSA
jgi:putative membrane protein